MTDAERIEEKVWAAVCLMSQRGQAERRRKLYAAHRDELADLAERGFNAADMADRIATGPA